MPSPNILVIHGSALEYLDAAATCDVIITDPPFSDHVHRKAASTRTGGVGPRNRDLGFDCLSPELRDAIARMAAKVSRWSIVFSDLEGTHLWRDAMAAVGVEYVRETPWDRWSQPQITGDRPPQGAEAVLQFHAATGGTIDPCAVLAFHAMHPAGPRGGAPKPLAKHWNGPGSLTCYRASALRGADKHPTEKPLDLALDLVSSFSDPGECILDPCAGRGTFGLAARILGRDAVLIEQDAVWACECDVRTREHAELSARDAERIERWSARVFDEASAIPVPTVESMRPTYERAQRRLADVERADEFSARKRAKKGRKK